MVLTDKQYRTLCALAEFTFLTPSQLVILGIGHINNTRRTVKELCELPSDKRPYIGRLTFPSSTRFGRLENVYYLKKQGAQILCELNSDGINDIPFVKTVAVYSHDYRHRKHTINFQIYLTQAIEKSYGDVLELEFFDRYFDKTGANHTLNPDAKRLRAKTRVDFDDKDFIIPDACFCIQRQSDPSDRALFFFEMANGKDTKRVLRQIEKYQDALAANILSEKYAHTFSPNILFVFDEKKLLATVASRFFDVVRIDEVKPLFYFAHINDVAEDAFNCWQRAREIPGSRFTLFGKQLS